VRNIGDPPPGGSGLARKDPGVRDDQTADVLVRSAETAAAGVLVLVEGYLARLIECVRLRRLDRTVNPDGQLGGLNLARLVERIRLRYFRIPLRFGRFLALVEGLFW
jgi:hypothetical protein